MAQSNGALGVALDVACWLFPSLVQGTGFSGCSFVTRFSRLSQQKSSVLTNLEQSRGHDLRMRIVFCLLRIPGRSHWTE
jgi:hypothetical protein